MKKIKIIFALLAVFLIVFTTSVSASAAESQIEKDIETEVEKYVAEGKLEEWHLEMLRWDGYICFYNKIVNFSGDFQRFASLSEDQVWTYVTWYQYRWNDIWADVIANLDVRVEYLEPNEILGIYYDSYFASQEDSSCIFLL